MLFIEITDNGSGISEEKLPRLFEPYYTSKRNGIGLGLASTLNIIQVHGGAIEVNSEINKFTVFTVLLPLKSRYRHRQNIAGCRIKCSIKLPYTTIYSFHC